VGNSGSSVPPLPAPGQQAPVRLPIQVTSIRQECLLFRPAGTPPEGNRWPLMLFLHGIGESAVLPVTEAPQDISAVARYGPPRPSRDTPTCLSSSSRRSICKHRTAGMSSGSHS
jgi:hypothetical protein